MKTIKILLILVIFTLLSPVSALAQSYSFEVPEATVDVFWNGDGTMTLNYEWLFANRLGAAPIDYIDLGLPSEEYDLSSITAEVDGQPITDIQASPYVKPGVALGLGANAIQPGQTGRVRAIVPVVRAPLNPDDSQDGYISAQFAPSWFDSQFREGQYRTSHWSSTCPRGAERRATLALGPLRLSGPAAIGFRCGEPHHL